MNYTRSEKEQSTVGRATIKKWFRSKLEMALFSTVCVLGFISSFITFPLLEGFIYNFGKPLLGVFVPPFLTLSYVLYLSFQRGLDRIALVKTLIAYCFQIIPFAPLFFQKYVPTAYDDFGRYYLYAKNMLDNHTLWGGDKLFFPDAGLHFVTQPGYRYLIYLELLMFGGLYRFVEFLNIGFYVLTVFYFQKTISYVVTSANLKRLLSLLVLLFSPYAIKNLLMGIPEWFTVLLLMWAAYFTLVLKWHGCAVFIIGLVPFFRQNLLFTALLLFLYILSISKKRLILMVLFLIALFLPVYHNLIYADEWRFFVDVFSVPFIKYTNTGELQSLNYDLLLNNLIHYSGGELEGGHFELSFFAALFLPFSVALYFLLLSHLSSFKQKLYYVVTTMSAVLPAILFGNAYYPRFEFVNVAVMLITFLLLTRWKAHLGEIGSNAPDFTEMPGFC